MDAQIRQPERSDVSAIIDLQGRALGIIRTPSDLIQELARDHVICRVLRSRDRVLGFLNAWAVADTIELTEIAIEPTARNRGYGRSLLRWLIEFGAELGCTRIILEVRAGNVAARSLYESFGFAVDGVRTAYYGDGEDAHLYSLEISSGVASS